MALIVITIQDSNEGGDPQVNIHAAFEPLLDPDAEEGTPAQGLATRMIDQIQVVLDEQPTQTAEEAIPEPAGELIEFPNQEQPDDEDEDLDVPGLTVEGVDIDALADEELGNS